MKLNFDLFPLIIHPEDLSLWNNFLEIIPQHLQALHEKRNEIDHISCTVRLIRKNSYTKDPLSQVLYQRMIPVWKNEKISYLICSVELTASPPLVSPVPEEPISIGSRNVIIRNTATPTINV